MAGGGWGECDSWQRQCNYEVTVGVIVLLNCGFSVGNMIVLKVTALSSSAEERSGSLVTVIIALCMCSCNHLEPTSISCMCSCALQNYVLIPLSPCPSILCVHVTLKILLFCCHSVCPSTVGKRCNCSTEVGCRCYATFWVWYLLWVLRHFLSNQCTCLSQYLLQCGGLR